MTRGAGKQKGFLLVAGTGHHDPGSSSLLDKVWPVWWTEAPGRGRPRMWDRTLTRPGLKPAPFFTLPSTRHNAESVRDVHT